MRCQVELAAPFSPMLRRSRTLLGLRCLLWLIGVVAARVHCHQAHQSRWRYVRRLRIWQEGAIVSGLMLQIIASARPKAIYACIHDYVPRLQKHGVMVNKLTCLPCDIVGFVCTLGNTVPM